MTEAFVFSIFGATGNLAFNKLFPALYQLYQDKKLSNISMVAIGRKNISETEYLLEVERSVQNKLKHYIQNTLTEFLEKITYYQMDFQEKNSYEGLKNLFEQLDTNINEKANRIFYLATAPSDFSVISQNLKDSGVLETTAHKRAVFEKPFGYDLNSAKEINKVLTSIFQEENIFRIDHYLGKEMIQNIMTIRFYNHIFENVWDNKSIDNVQITIKENEGVEGRGGYYDRSGALRDMIQNHLFQTLAIVAMEKPESFETEQIRNEKVRVLENVKLELQNTEAKNIVFGQYNGYLNEDKVEKNSKTETFVAMKCEIDNKRWKGVPFFLRTGKYLDKREAEVIIEFKKTSMNKEEESIEPNLLIIKIQPEEGIYFKINTRKPKTEREIMPVSMDYCQSCNIYYRSPEAYERLLWDIIQGDSTLFTRWDEVEVAWKLVESIIMHCRNKECLEIYDKKTKGPEGAETLIANYNRQWWSVEDLERAKFDF